MDFSEGDLLQFFYRFSVLFIRILRFHVIAAQQLVATRRLRKRGVEQPATSRIQILGGHHDTAVRVTLPLQLRESEMFDLGSVPYKDSDELCVACVLSAPTLSVQKGGLVTRHFSILPPYSTTKWT